MGLRDGEGNFALLPQFVIPRELAVQTQSTEPADATLIQDEDLDQGDASGLVGTLHNRGVEPRRQGSQNGGLTHVAGRQSGGFNLRLLGVLPIVIRGDERTILVVQLQGRVRQGIGHPKSPKVGPIARTITSLGKPSPAPTIKPPIMTLSPPSTNPRVLSHNTSRQITTAATTPVKSASNPAGMAWRVCRMPTEPK